MCSSDLVPVCVFLCACVFLCVCAETYRGVHLHSLHTWGELLPTDNPQLTLLHTHAHTHTPSHAHTRLHKHTHTHTPTHTQRHTQLPICAHTHTSPRPCAVSVDELPYMVRVRVCVCAYVFSGHTPCRHTGTHTVQAHTHRAAAGSRKQPCSSWMTT